MSTNSLFNVFFWRNWMKAWFMLANSPPHPNTDFALFDDPLILLLYHVQPCQIVILEPSIFWRQLFCVKWLFWAVIFSGIKANDYFIISFTCVVQFGELRITRCSHSSWFEGTSPGFLLFFFYWLCSTISKGADKDRLGDTVPAETWLASCCWQPLSTGRGHQNIQWQIYMHRCFC